MVDVLMGLVGASSLIIVSGLAVDTFSRLVNRA